MFLNIFLLIIGFVLLVKGADVFVDGSSSIAKLLKVPPVVVGLTVVSFGTSLPELSVSLSAAIAHENALAISNIVGSNIFNALVVLGVCAMIIPINVNKSLLKREFPLFIFTSLLLVVLVCESILSFGLFTNTNISKLLFTDIDSIGILSKIDSIILLIIFIAFMIATVRFALKSRSAKSIDDSDNLENYSHKSAAKSVLFIIAGGLAIAFGGDIVVNNATALATYFGMSPTLVGLTIVAMGTSLPELVTSVVAARKGENDLAVGNVVGSNLFNILFILGVSGFISPISISLYSIIDMIIMCIISIVTYFFCITAKKINRFEGFIFLVAYALFTCYIIIR